MKWTKTSKNVQNPQRVAQFQSSNSTYMEDGSLSCFKEFVFVYKYIRSFCWNPSPPNHHCHSIVHSSDDDDDDDDVDDDDDERRICSNCF